MDWTRSIDTGPSPHKISDHQTSSVDGKRPQSRRVDSCSSGGGVGQRGGGSYVVPCRSGIMGRIPLFCRIDPFRVPFFPTHDISVEVKVEDVVVVLVARRRTGQIRLRGDELRSVLGSLSLVFPYLFAICYLALSR